jgi:hypothetical protein
MARNCLKNTNSQNILNCSNSNTCESTTLSTPIAVTIITTTPVPAPSTPPSVPPKLTFAQQIHSLEEKMTEEEQSAYLNACDMGKDFLFCCVLKVAAPAILATMYSKKKDSMTIPLSVYMWHKKTKTTALLDSGATHNFINKHAVSSLGLGTCSLPHPLQVNNVDSSINSKGSITQYFNLWV